MKYLTDSKNIKTIELPYKNCSFHKIGTENRYCYKIISIFLVYNLLSIGLNNRPK